MQVTFVDCDSNEMATGTLAMAEKEVKRGSAVRTSDPSIFRLNEAAVITEEARIAARQAALRRMRKL